MIWGVAAGVAIEFLAALEVVAGDGIGTHSGNVVVARAVVSDGVVLVADVGDVCGLVDDGGVAALIDEDGTEIA